MRWDELNGLMMYTLYTHPPSYNNRFVIVLPSVSRSGKDRSPRKAKFSPCQEYRQNFATKFPTLSIF